MKRITQILFGFMCGILLCTAPATATSEKECAACKTVFEAISTFLANTTDDDKCDLSRLDTEVCAGFNSTELGICDESKQVMCQYYHNKGGTADDFCESTRTSYCVEGGGEITSCPETCPPTTYEDDGTEIVRVSYKCESPSWTCERQTERVSISDDNDFSICATGGTCEKYECHYNTNLGGITCDQRDFSTPYCSCPDIDGRERYFRLVCNSDTDFDYSGIHVDCGQSGNLYCDMSVQGSVGMCRYRKECQNCQSSKDWTPDGGGYQVYTTATCDYRTGTCNKSYKYRCDKGYYGNPTSSRTGCKRCPDNAICDTAGTTAFSCAAGYYKASNNATSCTKCPENAKDCPAGSTTFTCKTGYYKESTTATKCTNCPVPSTLSGNNYEYSDATGTTVGVTSCALKVGSTVEDDGGYYEIIKTPCHYQQGKQ